MAGFVQSRQSLEDYFAWRRKRAKPAVDRIQRIRDLENKKVLDIGCGFGALTSLLAERGAMVTSVEVSNNKLKTAKKLLGKYKNVKLKQVESELLPFKDESFDMIFLFDVIEHIENPEVTISECSRLLRKKGLLYVEFTPYYSFTGHHLYDYSKLPIHIFPKETIKKMIYSKRVKSFMTPDDYWETFDSLNKLRISKFQSFVSDFKALEEKYIIKYPEIFEINLPYLKILGPFKDLFTMSFEGVYRKR